jgi:hypothetical protein
MGNANCRPSGRTKRGECNEHSEYGECNEHSEYSECNECNEYNPSPGF